MKQTLINWKSVNPEHSNYEVPLLKKNLSLDEQEDWTQTSNHVGSDLLLLLVDVLGEQQVTMGYYYEHKYTTTGNIVVNYKRKYFSDLRYAVYCHEVENVVGWCYASDVTLLNENIKCVFN